MHRPLSLRITDFLFLRERVRVIEHPAFKRTLGVSAALFLGAFMPSSARAMSCDLAGKYLRNYERICREQPRYCGDVPIARAQKNDACRAEAAASVEPAVPAPKPIQRAAPSSPSAQAGRRTTMNTSSQLCITALAPTSEHRGAGENSYTLYRLRFTNRCDRSFFFVVTTTAGFETHAQVPAQGNAAAECTDGLSVNRDCHGFASWRQSQ